MTPRRAHTKSRKGCFQCKRRRVKCNEISPRCGQCATRGLTCSYSISGVPHFNNNNHSTDKPCSNTNSVAGITRNRDSDFHTSLGTLSSVVDSLSSANHKLELELLHMYSTSTYKACVHNADNGPARDLWQCFIPREALRHDFLMKAILAFASLHVAAIMDDADEGEIGNGIHPLWLKPVIREERRFDGCLSDDFTCSGTPPTTTTEPRGTLFASRPSIFYYQKALEYQTQASSSFRPVLNHITPDNCHAVLGFSIVMVLSALGVPRHSMTDKIGCFSPGASPMQSIFTMFEFLRGIESVSAAGHAWLKAGPFGQFILGYDDFWGMEVQPIQPEAAEVFQMLQSLNDEQYGSGQYFTATATATATDIDIDIDISEDHHHSSTRYKTIHHAISQLETSFAKVTQGNLDPALLSKVPTPEEMWGERGPILAWLGLVGPVFIGYLHDGESMSLLVFLHWGVLLNHLGDLWWARNAGRLLVEEISGILHARGDEWRERTSWARGKVGLL